MIRAKLEDGTYPYLGAVINGNGRIKQSTALVNGVETKVEGPYYIRFTENGNRRLVCVGDDAAEARAAAEKRGLKLAREAKALGIQMKNEPQPVAGMSSKGIPLAEAVKKYFSNLEARGLDPKSISVNAVDSFVA